LVIANPTSQSGKGEEAAQFVERFLATYEHAPKKFKVVRTQGAGDGKRLAAQAHGYSTVVALGGDGIIHEVVNGLMEQPANKRPALGIIPMGSGNDFARTLHMAQNSPVAALGQVLNATPIALDLGWVNGVYFMETLSFGLDAAIAIDTVERRKKNGSHGTKLFAASGLDVFTSNRHGFAFSAILDGRERIEGEEIVFAVQNGPTYGGGFTICPEADPTNGLLNLCYTTRVPPLAKTLALFGLAKGGKHTVSKDIHFATAKRLTISFEVAPPAQTDGEKLTGTTFDIRVEPAALTVLVPQSCRFNPAGDKPAEKPSLMEGLFGTAITRKLRG
jgi:YegS/Rv2252/BmrU family lipid kinase